MGERRQERRERLVSLDAFRGATIAAMLLVNNPGSWEHVYPPLRHAVWHGCTPTDLIFPFFVFIMGSAMAFSLRRRRPLSYERVQAADAAGSGVQVARRIITRSFLLILLGLMLNGFPGYDLQTLRIPGVLQRLGLVYLITAPLVMLLPAAARAIAAIALLAAWAAALLLVPVNGLAPALEPEHNLQRLVDLRVIGPAHLWRGGPTDPEGLLGTAGAVATCLMGYWAGALVRDRERSTATALRLAAAGLLAAVVGLAASPFLPINKPLWTPTYALFTGGLAAITLAACLWLIDVKRKAGWFRPFTLIGMNAIAIFVGAGIMARLLGMIRVGGEPSTAWFFGVLNDIGLTPKAASLAFAVLFVMVWTGIAWAMAKRRWFIRV